MFSLYFPDKNYTALYLHVFGDTIANNLIQTFAGALLYSLGMPLALVILFFGLEFGLRGLIAPVAPIIASRIGIKKAMSASYVSLIIFFICLGLAHISLYIGFFAFIFRSISRGIYYPCADTLHSVLIKDGSRGKQYTFEQVGVAISGLLATIIGTAALLHAFHFAIICLIAVLLLAIAPLMLIMDEVNISIRPQISTAYKFLISEEYKENVLPFSGYAVAIIGNITIMPLFIFVLVHKAIAFGDIIFYGLLIQIIFLLIYGVLMDRKGHKETLPVVGGLQIAGNMGFIIATCVPYVLIPLTGTNNTIWSLFMSNYNTRIQQKANKRGNAFLFNTVVQMNLCFIEVIVLSVLALVALCWGTKVFVAVFLISCLGLIMSMKYFKD
jgi:MFS family permease